MIGPCWCRILLETLAEDTEVPVEETTEEVVMEHLAVETMEEVPREEVLPRLQHLHQPVVLLPLGVLEV